ncbi:MAG: biosynthetic-type acetolactate synthase large subunit [Kiritimatiellia bacterium]|jgi:acetolactate synthase-1/2/3 large subunit|nr:biosynthetic-type acetolactate synthase large subunit [Kiritimatiellia bacterium]
MTAKPMTGAEALVKCLENEGVEYIWGLSGGAALPIFDALFESKIKLILVRHEQGATHMADGYARATGRPGVVLVTSGPGATNTITGVMTAHMDSVPMVVLTGQTISPMLGKDAFQEADVFDISMPVVKHSYLIKNTADIPRIIREAFHITNSGRPGPVMIDIPKDFSAGEFEGELHADMDLPGYSPGGTDVHEDEVMAIAEALSKSHRPVLLVGHGVLISGGQDALKKLAETLNAPVTTTLLGKGAFPESHSLALGMLGMHGTAYSNKAVAECDLIMSIGSRFDDRIIGKPSVFCKNATRIHVDIEESEFGRMIQCDHYCAGDAKQVIEELLKHVGELNTSSWLDRLDMYKRRFPLTYKKRGGLKVQHILDTLNDMLKGEGVIATDVGQHQMWSAQFMKCEKPNSWLSSGGAGTMGYGFPAAIGAQFGRPNEPVWAIVGDGGFQMTMAELATAAINRLPVKVIIMNNSYLGMVRQWQTMFYDDRKCGVDLEGNPDFARLTECYENAKGFTLKRVADIRKILERAMEYNEGPCIINAIVEKTENVFPMIPSGAPLETMMIKEPKSTADLEKPTGST